MDAWAEIWRRVWEGAEKTVAENSDDLVFSHRPLFVCVLPISAV